MHAILHVIAEIPPDWVALVAVLVVGAL